MDKLTSEIKYLFWNDANKQGADMLLPKNNNTIQLGVITCAQIININMTSGHYNS